MDIFRIGDGRKQTKSDDEIGAKAANLARMAALGLPVPPAFVIPIALCAAVSEGNAAAERRLGKALSEGIGYLETVTGRKLGDRRRPLLVSVRSGAARSMPGMLDTVLNVGCTAAGTRGLIRISGNPGFAWDSRRRFIESYAETVLGLDHAPFAAALGDVVNAAEVDDERDLDAEDHERLAAAYEAAVAKLNVEIPDDPMAALVAAAHGVCGSWMSERARTYRRLQKLEHLQGTAITVQTMVFGNRGLTSGSGVAFSRDPSSGSPEPVIDFLFDAQGEDVVSGRRTPRADAAIAQAIPAAFAELRDVLARLERHFGDVQDVEFTVEDGRLYVLQTRAAKRTPRAALRFAIDFVHDGALSADEAVQRLADLDTAALAITRFAHTGRPSAHGVGASAGVAAGRVAFTSAAAQRLAGLGDPVILVRPDTSTADVTGFAAAAGILTALGGRTAHAALVARQMGKPCVVGCAALSVDEDAGGGRLGDTAIREGDWLSVDGGSGDIFMGQLEIITERPEAELDQLARWRAAAAVRQSA